MHRRFVSWATLIVTAMLLPTLRPAPASASETAVLVARDTARVPNKGQWSVGVFNPLEIGIAEGMSIQTHPLLLLASPNATLRMRYGEVGGWKTSHEIGLSLPRVAMTQPLPLGLAGWFFPACKVTQHDPSMASTCDQAGWILVPSLAGVASHGTRHVWTVRAEIAVGVPLSGELGRPLEAHAPIDLLFAPATYGLRTRVGVRYDRALADAVRLSGEVNGYILGGNTTRSQFLVTSHLGLDVAVGAHSRFTVGVLYANQDQGAVVEEQVGGRWQRRAVRSNDFYPTIDFIWGG